MQKWTTPKPWVVGSNPTFGKTEVAQLVEQERHVSSIIVARPNNEGMLMGLHFNLVTRNVS